jgi:hypothetical protein
MVLILLLSLFPVVVVTVGDVTNENGVVVVDDDNRVVIG